MGAATGADTRPSRARRTPDRAVSGRTRAGYHRVPGVDGVRLVASASAASLRPSCTLPGHHDHITAVWQLGVQRAGSVAVLEPGAPFPAERAYFGATGSSAGAWLSRFTSGSFSALTLANGAPAGAEWSGENLIGRIRLPSGFIVRVSGILGTGSPAYRVRELSSTPPDARVPTLRLRFHDWIPEPALDGALVARRVERLDAEGRVVELLELTSVRPINNEEFERVTAIPAHDGEDPIRGASTYTSIFDYRPGAHTFTSISADGTTTTIPLATAREGWPGMRALGWIVAAIMVACLLWVRIHRARRLTSAAYGRPSPE